jgi:hypothetical protein
LQVVYCSVAVTEVVGYVPFSLPLHASLTVANLGMEVMHERNAHNFPLDLASVEAPSVNA